MHSFPALTVLVFMCKYDPAQINRIEVLRYVVLTGISSKRIRDQLISLECKNDTTQVSRFETVQVQHGYVELYGISTNRRQWLLMF